MLLVLCPFLLLIETHSEAPLMRQISCSLVSQIRKMWDRGVCDFFKVTVKGKQTSAVEIIPEGSEALSLRVHPGSVCCWRDVEQRVLR